MLAVTRINQIRDIVSQNSSVTVMELAQRFDVTAETIRRDLKRLEDEGSVVRVYGGAYSTSGVQNDVNIQLRENILPEEKRLIASRCLPFLHDGDSIFLDCSTTALQLASLIKEYSLTVITNSMRISQELAPFSNITLIQTGGRLHQTSMSFLGPSANRALSEFYVDKSFVSCRSISLSNGISDSNENQGAIRRIAIEHCDQAILLADHTKFGATSFIHITDFSRINTLVTDMTLSPEWREGLTAANVTIIDS